MKKYTFIGTILFLIACNEKDKPNLDGFDNYRTFDEFQLVGIEKLADTKKETNYFSIRKYNNDSIKVYTHKTETMETYIKKDKYWYSKFVEYDVKPQDEIEDDSKINIKYIFNDTIVTYEYYKGGKNDLYKKDETASIDIYTKQNKFGVGMKNVELNYIIIHDIISLLKENRFKKSKYFSEGYTCDFYDKSGNGFRGFEEVSIKLQESKKTLAPAGASRTKKYR